MWSCDICAITTSYGWLAFMTSHTPSHSHSWPQQKRDEHSFNTRSTYTYVIVFVSFRCLMNISLHFAQHQGISEATHMRNICNLINSICIPTSDNIRSQNRLNSILKSQVIHMSVWCIHSHMDDYGRQKL